jgi:hypothetical protein
VEYQKKGEEEIFIFGKEEEDHTIKSFWNLVPDSFNDVNFYYKSISENVEKEYKFSKVRFKNKMMMKTKM